MIDPAGPDPNPDLDPGQNPGPDQNPDPGQNPDRNPGQNPDPDPDPSRDHHQDPGLPHEIAQDLDRGPDQLRLSRHLQQQRKKECWNLTRINYILLYNYYNPQVSSSRRGGRGLIHDPHALLKEDIIMEIPIIKKPRQRRRAALR